MMKAKLALAIFALLSLTVIKAQAPFELDEFLNGSFVNRGFSGSWITDTEFVFNSDGIQVHNMVNNSSSVLVPSSVLTEYKASGYELSPDMQFLLISYDPISIFRHSTTARHVIYDLTSKIYHDVAEKNQLSLVQWSPTSNAFVYVLNNNVWYQSTPSDAPIQLTTDGVPGMIYNGVPDWVYEEEVLGSGSAIWFSPEGTQLAIISFDDTNVKDAFYFMYGQPGSLDDQYSTLIDIKYPKVGTINPTVTLKAISLTNLPAITWTEIPAPVEIVGEDHVIFTVTWAMQNTLTVVWTNRVQNLAVLMSCSANLGECRNLVQIEEPRGWLEISTPVFHENGGQFLWIVTQSEGDDSYRNLVMYSISETEVTQQRLTTGKKEVTSVVGWDTTNNIIYFSGSGENEPSEQHVYRVATATMETSCITCAITQPEGICKSAGATLSLGKGYLAISCTGPGPTIVSIRKTTDLLGTDGLMWENNSNLRNEMAQKLQPRQIDRTMMVSDGFEARVRLLLPPGLNVDDADTKYPMIVNVYGGPNSNQINDRFSVGYQSYMITNRNIIYAYIDGRGSGRKGDNMMFEIYRNLGTVEIEDQIRVTKNLQEAYPWIDAARTAIWGWSYGGYATSMVLAKDIENVFKCGISVAPVSSWIYYDSIYTERYMGLPTEEDNLSGYNGTDVTRLVEGIRGKEFLLIHGNADDNVHYQQAMALARALELADIPFLQQSYPDENHGLRGVSQHLYHTMDEFWTNCLNLEDARSSSSTSQVTQHWIIMLFLTFLCNFRYKTVAH